MNGSGQHVRVQRGNGLVARFGPAVVVLATSDADDGPFVPALLTALDEWSAAGGESAEDFAWRVAGLMSAHRAAAPAFGVAVPKDDGHLLLLHGAVRAMVTGPDGTTELSGLTAATWVDQVIAGPTSRLAITLTDSGQVEVDARSDLRGGLVGGDGLVLTQSAAGPQPTHEVATPANVTQPRPSPIDLPPPVEVPPPVDVPSAQPSAPAVGNVSADDRRAWPVAGETAFVEVTDRVLVADDGTRILLDRHYVFGRDPFHDPAVLSGAASPIVVRDPDQLISRVQVQVWMHGPAVMVRDGGSANGTFVAAPGANEWTRLGDLPVVLAPGWSMRIGRRVYTYVATAIAG